MATVNNSRRIVMITPGLWAELAAYAVDTVIEGVNVHAVIDIDPESKMLFIDSLEVSRGDGVITPEMLRTITIPVLTAASESPIRFYVDEDCTIEYDEQKWEGETLEEWAARIFWMAFITRKPAAKEIARVQGIKPGSAHQRLVVARKMGLLNNELVREAAREVTKNKKKGKN